MNKKQKFRSRSNAVFSRMAHNRSKREQELIRKFALLKSKSAMHLQLPNYFTPEECGAIKSLGNQQSRHLWENINFDSGVGRFQRLLMQAAATQSLQGLPKSLADLLQLIRHIHPKTSLIKVKLLRSIPPCPMQQVHTDDGQLSDQRANKKFADLSFSLIIALEPDSNPTSIYMYKGKEAPFKVVRWVLQQGTVLLLRGDFPHAGAEYDRENLRAFITIGTRRYPHRGTSLGVFPDLLPTAVPTQTEYSTSQAPAMTAPQS